MLGHEAQDKARRFGLFGRQNSFGRFADQRNVPNGIAGFPEIEVVDAHRFLEKGGVLLKRINGQHRRVGMAHVIAADQP